MIGDQNKPPPLPSTTIPRPRLIQEPASPGAGFDDANGYPFRSRSAGGEDSSDSGSFSSHMTRNRPALESQWSVTSSGAPVRSLRDLQRKQSETNDRDLGFVDDGGGLGGGHAPFVGRQSSNQSHLSQESSHSAMSYSANNNNNEVRCLFLPAKSHYHIQKVFRYTVEPHLMVTSLVRKPPHYSHPGSVPNMYSTVQITPCNKVTSPLRSLLPSPVGELNSKVPLYCILLYHQMKAIAT